MAEQRVADLEFQIVDCVVQDRAPVAPDSVCDSDLHGYALMETLGSAPSAWRATTACVVLLFGRTADGRSVMIQVDDWRPALYYYKTQSLMVHKKAVCHAMNEYDVKRQRGRSAPAWKKPSVMEASELRARVVNRVNFYYWEPDPANPTQRKEHPYVEMRFPTLAAMRKASQCTDAHEDKVEPTTKFFDDLGLTPSGWAKVSGATLVDSKASHCDVEARCGTSHISSVDRDALAPLKVAYFDIETISASMEFPEAQNEGDCVTHVGIHFGVIGGDLKRVLLVVGACDAIEGIQVVACESEASLLDEFRSWIVREDPDMIVQYNGFSFDWPYLMNRATSSFAKAHTFPYLSRLIVDKCRAHDKDMSSKARGDNDMTIIPVAGRVHIDLYHWLKAQPSIKLESYKLDNVAEHFLGEHKVEMDYQELFVKAVGDAAAKREVGVYCDKDVYLLSLLCAKLKVFPGDVEMSRITHTLQEHLITRGQQIKVDNQLVWYGHRSNARDDGDGAYILNTPEVKSGTAEDSYEGATVLDAEDGYYKNDPVAVLDFMSLYPSIILANNFCYSTLVGDPALMNTQGVTFKTIRVDERKVYTFVDMKGLLQEILETLLGARKRAKKLKAEAISESDAAVYSAREKALKVSANSMYGYTGAVKTNKWSCLAIADSVTWTARDMLHATVRYIKEFTPCKVIYGDTDSVMVVFEGCKDVQSAFVLGSEGADVVTARFKSKYVVLEMEKVYFPYYLFGKKMYAGLMYTLGKDGAVHCDGMDAKGINIVRRDVCAFSRETCSSVLHCLMYDKDDVKACDQLEVKMRELREDRVPREQFKLSKTLRKTYANEESQVHWNVVNKMRQRRPGSEPRPGERVPFVYVVHKNPKAKAFERSEDPKYAEDHGLKIDRLYYLDHQIVKPMTMLLSKIVSNADTLFDHTRSVLMRQQSGNVDISKFLTGAVTSAPIAPAPVFVTSHDDTSRQEAAPKRKQTTLLGFVQPAAGGATLEESMMATTAARLHAAPSGAKKKRRR